MKTIKIGELKAHLSRELRHIRNGESIIVQDRNTPIATITPIVPPKPLVVFPPKSTFHLPEIEKVQNVDPLDFLMEDRNSR